MLPGAILVPALRYGLFALLAVVLPGIALQRLLRLRADPALVLPLGLSFCALAHWIALLGGTPWVFAALVVMAGAALLKTRLGWCDGPSLRGALPPFLAVLLCFAASVWRQDRLDDSGAFLAGSAQADDAAFHVGLAHELALGYPPQVPGLSGFRLNYHLGAPLVRAAALRFAGVHPYDALSRFDNTLYALALILALRAAAHALGGGGLAVSLAGWSVLAADLSFLLAPGKGIRWWVGVFEGGTALQSLFHANSLLPALALALGGLVALRRHLAGEGRGFLAIAVLAGAACPFFKVFPAAQYLGALAVALLFARRRRPLAALAAGVAAGLAPLLLGRGGDTMQVAFEPLGVLNQARDDLGLVPAHGLGLLAWLPAWLLLSLGLRALGLPRALRALVSGDAVAAALAAFGLLGWPLGLLFRVSPLESGARDRPFNEALYFFEHSGFVLWLFAALALGAVAGRGLRRAAAIGGVAALTLPSTAQFVWRERILEPWRIPPAAVRATEALERATRPGDVVLVRPERQRYPPPPLLIGRRVPFTRFIPFFAQLAPRQALLARYRRTAAFFETEDAAEALGIARELDARVVCLFGSEELRFPAADLEPVFETEGARVYRLPEAGPGGGAPGAATRALPRR